MPKVAKRAAPAAMPKLQRQTTTAQVVDALRQQILSGHLAPGEALRQEAIGEALGVSRIPVREAIRLLEAEGMVDVLPHRGAFVCALSVDELNEAFEIRRRLEPWLFEEAVRKIDAESLATARALVTQMDNAHEADWGRLNWALHETLYRPAQREMTLAMLKRLHDRTDRYFRFQIVNAPIRAQAHAEHMEMIEICEQRDVGRAAAVLEHHIATAAAQIRGIVEQLMGQRDAQP